MTQRPRTAREVLEILDELSAADAWLEEVMGGRPSGDDQGEIIPFDAAGMPVERRPRPTEARLLALDEQRPEAAIPTPSPAPAPPPGVVKARIIGAFEPPGRYTSETWERALGDAKRIAWLLPARVFAGAPKTSALWNPAMLAFCLCEHFRATPQRRRDYGRIIERHFPDWLPEWQEYEDSFRDSP